LRRADAPVRARAHRAARRRTQLAALLTGFAIFAALAVWL